MARFKAAKRLERHHKMSQWTVTISSVSLLIIPLVQVFGEATDYSAAQLNVIQSLLAVAVLVFSLLMSLGNHGVKSDQMHRCGMELNDLHRNIGLDESLDVKSLIIKYNIILDRYGNHENIDYLMMRLSKHKLYYPKTWRYVVAYILIHIRYSINFIAHIVFLLVVIAFVWNVFADLWPSGSAQIDEVPPAPTMVDSTNAADIISG